MNKQLLEQSRKLRELVAKVDETLHKQNEITYFTPKKSYKISDLPIDEQQKVIKMGAWLNTTR